MRQCFSLNNSQITRKHTARHQRVPIKKHTGMADRFSTSMIGSPNVVRYWFSALSEVRGKSRRGGPVTKPSRPRPGNWRKMSYTESCIGMSYEVPNNTTSKTASQIDMIQSRFFSTLADMTRRTSALPVSFKNLRILPHRRNPDVQRFTNCASERQILDKKMRNPGHSMILPQRTGCSRAATVKLNCNRGATPFLVPRVNSNSVGNHNVTLWVRTHHTETHLPLLDPRD
jgi:hypothetical protein